MVLFSYPFIKNNFFSLAIKSKSSETYLDMCIFSKTVNTAAIPQTSYILSELLPSIHASRCFNDEGLPFSKEVKRTEIGHLFEHILLEYIYQLKIDQGSTNLLITGETSWNWERDPFGMFHIIISIGLNDINTLPHALNSSIILFEKILSYDPYHGYSKTPTSHQKQTLYYKQMIQLPSVRI